MLNFQFPQFDVNQVTS